MICTNKVNFDFHLHVKEGSADAVQSIEEMMDTALSCGIKTVAITDHNKITSLRKASEIAKEKGINFICGVELSTVVLNVSPKVDYEIIHVLGLGIKPDEELFEELTKEAYERVHQWMIDIKKVCEREFNITLHSDDINEMRKEMVELGIFKDKKEAKTFTRSYRGNDIVPLMPLSIDEICDVIHRLGGVAIFAHPTRGENHKRFDLEDINLIVNHLISKGLDGIELYHKDVVREKEAFQLLEKIVNEKNLLVSLGSDRHVAFNGYGNQYFMHNEFLENCNVNFNKIKENIIKRISR